MPDSKSGATAAISRRSLIGAASAVSAIGSGAGASLASKDTVAQCAAWIALDLEIDRLALRWAALETLMARDHGWLALSQAERRALPEAAEMFEIDDTLEVLSCRRERMLKPLSRLAGDTPHAAVSKLAVAARLMLQEESPAQPFVANVVRELAEMRCPGCGAAYRPAGFLQPR